MTRPSNVAPRLSPADGRSGFPVPATTSRLQRQRQLADFIEEQSTAPDHVQVARPVAGRPRKSTFDAAEQFRLSKFSGMAPQFKSIKGRSGNPSRCTICTTISLPAPVGPLIRTVRSVLATLVDAANANAGKAFDTDYHGFDRGGL